MIRKYHKHKPQTTLCHCEEEPLNHHETSGRQIKRINQLSLPHQDDCNTRTDTKQRTKKHRTIIDSHHGSNNKQKSQQQQNHRLRTDSNLALDSTCSRLHQRLQNSCKAPAISS